MSIRFHTLERVDAASSDEGSGSEVESDSGDEQRQVIDEDELAKFDPDFTTKNGSSR